jgi:hypothetical protein
VKGFLSELLARSRGVADVVRPRVASLFEPQAAGLPGDEGEAAPEQESETVAVPSEPDTAGRRPPQEPEVLAYTSSAPGGIPAQREVDAVEIVEPVPSPRVSTEQPAPVAPAPMPPARARESAARGDTRALPETADTGVGRRSEADAGELPAVAARARHVERDVAGRRAVPPATQPLERQPPRPSELAARRPPALGSPVPHRLLPPPRRPRFEAPHGEERAPSSEPTVHVTIGRIEVRAVADQVPRRKERPASPVMSLDEYLASRSGKGPR